MSWSEVCFETFYFVFTIDGVSYLDDLSRGHISTADEQDPDVIHPCFAVGGINTGASLEFTCR